jgi:hypothetical protein
MVYIIQKRTNEPLLCSGQNSYSLGGCSSREYPGEKPGI